MIGSHLDSQSSGGRYDGQLGVLTALETLRTFEEQEIETDQPVEIRNWTSEKGTRFSPALFGSLLFTGALPLEETLRTEDEYDEGVTVGEELERIGYDGDHGCEPGGLFDVQSYLELHIEGGPKLDDADTSVGVVDGIFASTWLEITIEGKSDHACPTPIESRHDAFAAAATAGESILTLPNRLSQNSVATIGEVHVLPNKRNIISRKTVFSVDFRAARTDVVERFFEAMHEYGHGDRELADAIDQADVDKLRRVQLIDEQEWLGDVIVTRTSAEREAIQDLDEASTDDGNAARKQQKRLLDELGSIRYPTPIPTDEDSNLISTSGFEPLTDRGGARLLWLDASEPEFDPDIGVRLC